MFAVIATGVAKFTCCQPEAVSSVKVAVASSWPALVHRLAHVRAGVRRSLVEADAGDEAVEVGSELDPELDGVRDR